MPVHLSVLQIYLFIFANCISFNSIADSYAIDNESNIVGTPSNVLSKYEDTIYSLAVRHEVGAAAFANANPDIDPLLPGEGVSLKLPTQYVLPDVKREGIVINLPEMRLYYFPPGKDIVYVYPVGVGRQGWETPVMQSVISSISRDPVWTPPESIHKEYREAGLTLPRQVQAGPDNPLGEFALRVGDTSYLIHGTNNPSGVGLRVSHGCIRLYAEHIAELSAMVTVNTPVNIINQPIKLGRIGNKLFLQAHEPIRSLKTEYSFDYRRFIDLAESTLTQAELERVKRIMLDEFSHGDLFSGLTVLVISDN